MKKSVTLASKMHKRFDTFDMVNTVVMIVVTLIFALPILHIFSVSFSGPVPAAGNMVLFWPKDITLENYRIAFLTNDLKYPLILSLIRVVLGTSVNLVLVLLSAYPLSKNNKEFPGRTVYAGFYIFLLVFNGGLIPGYLLMKELHLLDTIWGLSIVGAIPIFHVVLVMNFFRQLPKEIEEAAMIDGANHFQVFLRICLPLSTPSLATITMMAILRHWNDWYSGLVFMSSNNYPYATYLKTLLTLLNKDVGMNSNMERMMQGTSYRALKMCYIVIAMLPIIFVFPFLQKHVRKGLTIGSVKG